MSISKRKICLVLPSLSAGGMERVMTILAKYLSGKKENKVVLILLTNRKEFFKIPKEVKVIRTDFNHRNFNRLTFTIKIFKYLRRNFKTLCPDTILSFGGKYNAFVILATIGLNTNIYISERSRPGISYGKFLDILNPIIYKKATGIIAQTSRAKAFTQKQTGHNNIAIIGNPIKEIPKINVEKENIILNVGRFIKSKQQNLLIDIFCEIAPKNWKLIFVGEGTEMNYCIKKAKNTEISNQIVFTGNISDIARIYAKSEIFAFTSISEGFPNALGEAMKTGLACISFDCNAGPSDLIDDDLNGILIGEGDYQLYIQKLKKLIEDTELRKELGRNAIKKMEEFGEEVISQQFETFITSHLAN
ncbi:MAG: glycosyltransferase [Bacteroidetes bacterium]|nr:glycosyltransferase [Bacteroidota bacterium]